MAQRFIKPWLKWSLSRWIDTYLHDMGWILILAIIMPTGVDQKRCAILQSSFEALYMHMCEYWSLCTITSKRALYSAEEGRSECDTVMWATTLQGIWIEWAVSEQGGEIPAGHQETIWKLVGAPPPPPPFWQVIPTGHENTSHRDDDDSRRVKKDLGGIMSIVGRKWDSTTHLLLPLRERNPHFLRNRPIVEGETKKVLLYLPFLGRQLPLHLAWLSRSGL